MKPLSEKTFVDQALKNGKGVTWLDGARIPINDDTGVWGTSNATANPTFNASASKHEFRSQKHSGGRFPANLLVLDDVLNDGHERTSGKMNGTYQGPSNYSDFAATTRETIGDSGSYSRYFDLDAWWAKTFPFIIVPKAAKSEKGAENKHPTVKPLKLMAYLIILGSRPGDRVLDPFLGSGTTAIAAKQLGRQYIGIEKEGDYVDIAHARLLKISSPLPLEFDNDRLQGNAIRGF